MEILSKENRKLLKNLGIVCHCPSLGCPEKNSDTKEERLRRKASGECNGKEENLKKFVMGLLCLLLKKLLRLQQIYNTIGTGGYLGEPCAI